MTYRDPLVATPPADNSGIKDALEAQMALFRAMYRELQKLNPSVLCTTVVQGGNSIDDTESHRVDFLVNGKKSYIYRLWIINRHKDNIRVSLGNIANGKDGILLPPMAATGTFGQLYLPVALETIYISDEVAGGDPLIINGPADDTNGGLFIWGWTIPEYEQ